LIADVQNMPLAAAPVERERASPVRPAKELYRVGERRRAVALALHYRESEGCIVQEIAERLGRRPSTVRSYLADPDAGKARRVKERYRGRCRRCGAPTSAGGGPGSAKALCARCKARELRKWSRPLIEAALRAWTERYGEPPRSTDLSRTYAQRHSGERLRRLNEGWEHGPWPSLSVVQYHFGTLASANRAAHDD
jgi:hypothetical protein